MRNTGQRVSASNAQVVVAFESHRSNHWPVKLEGIKDYPVNRGRLCPKGQAGLQVLYDPDRIRHPLRRKGKRGEGNWEKISWNEAIRLVTERLKILRQEGKSHHLVVWGGRYRGHMGDLFGRFMETYGSPNHLGNPARGSEGILKGHLFTMGVRDFSCYSLGRGKLCPLLWSQPFRSLTAFHQKPLGLWISQERKAWSQRQIGSD